MSEMGSFYWGWKATQELHEAWLHEEGRPQLSDLLRSYARRISAWLKR
jgi:hypothetical protein